MADISKIKVQDVIYNVKDTYARNEINTLNTDTDKIQQLLFYYTYIVDSDDKLKDWANCKIGNDYTHVLIKRGEWHLYADTINLTQSHTKTITAENGSLICHIVNLDVDEVVTFQYDTISNNDTSYFIDGVNAVTINRWSVINDNVPTNHNITSFKNCANLRNCISHGISLYPSASDCSVYTGYSQCNNLLNCSMIIIPETFELRDGSNFGITSFLGFSSCLNFIGFESCNHISSCKVTYTENVAIQTAIGLNKCTHIDNCTINIKSQNASSVTGCKDSFLVNNCYCDIQAINSAIGFYTTQCATMCYAQCESTNITSGFTNGHYFSSCHAYCTDGTDISGFENCNYVNNCFISIDNKTSLCRACGTNNCKGVQYCKMYCKVLNGSTIQPYHTSYSGLTSDTKYTCDNSFDGGWSIHTISTIT